MLVIENLTRSEKLCMMEAIWDDLARDSAKLESPDWHAQALRQAEHSYAEKQTDFISWDLAKKMLRDPAS
jgi:Putative addiction module component